MNYSINGATAANFDIQQAQHQLELLGIEDEIFLRGFYHSDDPRYGKDRGRKENGLKVKLIESWLKDKRGVYIVVNGGGHTDAKVKVGRAIFYEHDDLDKELQLYLWDNLGLPEPTFQIDTGDKSIHSYWVFAEPIPIEQWRQLQIDLLEFADADRVIKNPSRVMRLAGACHQNGNRSEIISDSGIKYGYEELREIIPEQVAKPKPAPTQLNKFTPVPLYICLTKDDRHLIDHGVGEGGRNDAGAKLARNLIGTAQRLEYLDYRVEGSPEDLFEDYCDHCSPPIDSRERAAIWKSALKDNPTATLTDEAIENCIKAHRRNQSQTSKKGDVVNPNRKVVQLSKDTPTTEDYRKAVLALLEKNLTESQLDLEIQSIASKFYKTDHQVWRLYQKLTKEDEKQENLKETAVELESLLASSNAALNLEDYLPGDLIQIKEVYERLCLRPEVGLMQFLSTVSGLLPTGSEIRLLNYTTFDQPMGVYFAVCAEPSQRKTPGQKAIVTKPLLALQKQADEIHRQEMIDYEQELKEWKDSKEEGLPPIEPKKRIYFINSATQAGLRRILNEQRSNGFVILHDELAADFRNRSKKYNSGLTEDLLSFYDGLGKREALGDGFASEFDEVLISVLGAIQPGVVAEFLNGENDPNGYWSRLSIVNQPITQLIIPPPEEQAPPIDMTPLLKRLYERVSNLQKFKLHFSRSAEELMRVVMNHCDEHRVKARTQGLAAQWGKMAGKIGRLAALLHIVEKTFYNESIETPVSKQTLNKAVKLGHFLINEAISLYADNSEDNLAAHLKQILTLATSKPGTDISARLVSQGVLALRKENPSVIRGYFDDLVEMGYGQIVGAGTRKKFRLESNPVQTVDRSTKDSNPNNQGSYSDFNSETVDHCRSKIYTPKAMDDAGFSQTVVNVDQNKKIKPEMGGVPDNNQVKEEAKKENIEKKDLQLQQLAETPSEQEVQTVDLGSTRSTRSTVEAESSKTLDKEPESEPQTSTPDLYDCSGFEVGDTVGIKHRAGEWGSVTEANETDGYIYVRLENTQKVEGFYPNQLHKPRPIEDADC